MVARLLLSGIVLGFLALAGLDFLPFPATRAANSHAIIGAAQPTQRAVLHPAQAGGQASRSAQHLSAVSAARQQRANPVRRNGQDAVFIDGRAGARKAVPVTRGQELGLRFRPDENESPYGQSINSRPGNAPGSAGSDELQSQFRPTVKKRKPTYEELYAEPAEPIQQMPPPIMPYPMLPPPLPTYGRGWPAW